MAIRKFKPTTPSRRYITVEDFSELDKKAPEKALTKGKQRSSGRNNRGRITSRRRGGGAKRRYRIIDFRRDKDNIPGRVEAIEYDPNRSSRIALLLYADGERRYILAPSNLKKGDEVISGERVPIKPGNVMPLSSIPLGSTVHAVEMTAGAGAKIARSAGTSVQLVARDAGMATLRLPSSEVRKVKENCRAAIGTIGNEEHENIEIGNAGRNRHMGRRPKVRGVVMNPVDHPHGGGEGKAPAGNPHPVSPWGQKAKGLKTRNPRKASSRDIVTRRKR